MIYQFGVSVIVWVAKKWLSSVKYFMILHYSTVVVDMYIEIGIYVYAH